MYAYNIREVFYNDEDQIIGWTVDGIDPYGESLEELAETIAWFAEALTKPILEVDPEDDNKLIGVVQGKAFDPNEEYTTYSSVEELMADLNSEEEHFPLNGTLPEEERWEGEGGSYR